MASIGEQLTQPEEGWKRYDDGRKNIHFPSSVSYYDGFIRFECSNGEASFKFTGTKLRLISYVSSNRSNDISIFLDDVEESISMYKDVPGDDSSRNIIVYEKTNLSNGIHTVKIKNNNDTSHLVYLDAIDIDGNGELLHHAGLSIKTSIEDMKIGDCILAEYVAPVSSQAGTISINSDSTKDLISSNDPPSNPDGSFYFIKVAPALLIADRVIQCNITWDRLNEAGFIEGKSNEGYLIRSLTGGVAHLNEDGTPSNDDRGFGAWPPNNEWDTYITNNDLNGKITPADTSIWNLRRISWVKEAIKLGVHRTDGVSSSSSKSRNARGYTHRPFTIMYKDSNEANINWGFRPVLQLKNPKQKTLWY